MSERFRITIILLALGAFALGCYDLANPYRPGQIGFDGTSLNNGDLTFVALYPGAAAERAGIRMGDVLLMSALSPREQFEMNMRRAGQSLQLPVQRGAKRLTFHLAAEKAKNKPVELGLLDLLFIFVFAATGVLVAVRGASRIEVRALASLFVAVAWASALRWLFFVAPSPALAFVGAIGSGASPGNGATLAGGVAQAALAYFLLVFVGHFPPGPSRLRSAVARIALPIAALLVLFSLWNAAQIWRADWTVFQIAGIGGSAWLSRLLNSVVVPVLVIVASIDGLMHVDENHRVQMRWIGIALIVAAIAPLYGAGYAMTGPTAAPLVAWFGIFGELPMLAIAYAILRHRIADVSFVFSRAATFAIMSAVVLVLVVALEWIAGQVLERGIGVEAANGVVGQALRLAVAVGVGLSAVPILKLVERWLNSVFFGKRAQALTELRRFALEADVVTNSGSLLTLACDSLRDNTEARYAAIYMSENGGYSRVRSSDESPPPALDQDDATIVRLRRWNEPFEMSVGAHALSEALMLPMTVGGSLLGVLVCGPKRERTHYLNEEIEALALVAHRVGTASYVLQRNGSTGA